MKGIRKNLILRKIKELIDMLFNKSKVIYYRDRKYCTAVLDIKGKKKSIDLFLNI